MFSCFYSIFITGSLGSDNYEIYLTTKNMVEHGKIYIAKEDLKNDAEKIRFGYNPAEKQDCSKYGNPVDKQFYSKYGILSSVLIAPFYLFGLFISKITQIDPFFATRICVNFFNCFVTAILLAFIYLFSRILCYSVKVSIVVSLLLGFTTMLWTYAVEGFSEPLAFLLLFLSMIFIVLYDRHCKNSYICWSVVFLFLAVLTKVYYAMFIIPVIIYFFITCFKSKDIKKIMHSILAAFITALPFMALILLTNKIKTNSYFTIGYINYSGNIKTTYAIMNYITGLYGHFISSGKSIFLYNPVIVLSLLAISDFYKKYKNESIMFLNCFIISMILFAPIFYWYGGLCWGSRYIYPLLPLMMLFLGEILSNNKFGVIKKNILPFLIIIGILIQIPSVMSGYFYWYDIMKKSNIDEEKILFVPKYSPLVGSWVIFESMIKHSAGLNSSEVVVKAGQSETIINLSEYDHISPCWFRVLSGKIVKYNKEVISISAPQRAVIIIWLVFLIFVVIFSGRKIYGYARNEVFV